MIQLGGGRLRLAVACGTGFLLSTLIGGTWLLVDRISDAVHSVSLSEWWQLRRELFVVSGGVGFVVLSLGSALWFALRRRDRVAAERDKAGRVMEEAIEALSVGIVIWDRDDRLVMSNQKYRSLYARSGAIILPGQPFEDIIRTGVANGQYPEAAEDPETFIRETISWHRENRGDAERLLPLGQWLMINERRTASGGFVGVRIDITALKKAQSDLQAANERAGRAMAEVQQQNKVLEDRDRALHTQNLLFEAALNNMSHGLLMADAAQRVIVCNRRFLELFELASAEITTGLPTRRMFENIKEGCFGADAADSIHAEQQALAAGHRAGVFVAESENGRALSIAQRPMADGGWVAIYEDVTEQQRAEGRIRFLAHHDDLTRLPNRVMFHARMAEALRIREDGHESVALLYLDLDKFKNINDTLGHPVGDALLVAVARRLRHCLQQSDVVARLGGDEFAVICLAPEMPKAAVALAERIIDALGAPYELTGRLVSIGVSVGIAVATDSDHDADTLLKNADMALYQAKEGGRGTCCIFEPAMEARLHARLQIENDLELALENDELRVVYQPIFDLRADHVSGFEALLRWKHPVRGFIGPAEFIPLAEETGLINGIGAWVLQQACRDAATLPEPIKIAVNLSPMQLKSEEIVQIVRQALEQSGLSPARLELEITETALLQDNEKTVAILHQLGRLGLRIVLDDFGTGYSSLSYLRTFPFHKLKIDQSFVREMATRSDCAAIVSSAVDLANRLAMTTTAEGVETADQLVMVRQAGCSEAQGYLFGRPNTIAHAAEQATAFSFGHAEGVLLARQNNQKTVWSADSDHLCL